MEGYILGGRNIAESAFKNSFKKIYGEKGLKEFERLFRDNFIVKEDFKNIAAMGANAIRVPFNARLIETKPFKYSPGGFSYLDKVLSWAEECSLGVILDLHAAVGSQNCDWHGDSSGKALLWKMEEYKKRTYALWKTIAARYKDLPALIGYDVLNEPVMDKKDTDILKRFYQETIKAIRTEDTKHTIFLEGNIWSQQIDFLSDLVAENIEISIHAYCPLNFTFNFTPFYKYPGFVDGELWDQATMYRYLEPYAKFSDKHKVKIYVGEFGINWRGGGWGELDWLGDILDVFEKFKFDYTYWTYKAVSQHVFPDGIYQYIANNDYIKREGPVYGWENYLPLWRAQKNAIVNFWKAENCAPNQKLISKLKYYFQK